MLSVLILAGCKQNAVTVSDPVIPAPAVTFIPGGSIKIKASDSFGTLLTDVIQLSDETIIPDNTPFRVTAVKSDVTQQTLLVSDNQVDWFREVVVYSLNGKVQAYVAPGTVPGIYRVEVRPVISDEGTKFENNLIGRFIVSVSAGDAATIQNVSSDRFEDLFPYDNIRQPSESWVVLSDPNIVSSIRVGPIVDSFGNRVSVGQVELTVSEGAVTGINPVAVSDGYAYFSYTPSANIGALTISASYKNGTSQNLIKNETMKLGRPEIQILNAANLEVLTQADFTEMLLDQTKKVDLIIKNKGSIASTSFNTEISAGFMMVDPVQSQFKCPTLSGLRPGEACQMSVSYTRKTATIKNGTFKVRAEPFFSSSLATLPLIVSTVEPASLVLSQSVVTFSQSACGVQSSQEIYAINTGSFPANNVNITQPLSSVAGQPPFFKLTLPPADPEPYTAGAIVNCGTTFKPNVKCRIIVEYQPLSTGTTPLTTALLNADSTQSLAISLSGSATAGQASGDLPVNLLSYLNRQVTTTMFAQAGQRTIVRVGPITDSCNAYVADGTLVSASVSGGFLTSATLPTSGGIVEFTWNAQSRAELLGNQIVTVSSASYLKEKTLLFQGVNIALTGQADFGQVIVEKPEESVYTVTNTGNIKAENISFNFNSPMKVVSLGSCANGIAPGASCEATLGAFPTINQDYSTSITASTVTPGLSFSSLTNININGRKKPVFKTEYEKYIFNEGSNSPNVSRTVTLTNQGPAISYATTFAVESPYVIQSSNCQAIMGVGSSCSMVISANRDAALALGAKKLTIGNEVELQALLVDLSYTELKFSTQDYVLKKYYCVGPYSIKSIGSGGSETTVSSRVQVTLSSESSKIKFYNESTCNDKITTVNIEANTASSSNFYVRSIASGVDFMYGVNGSFPRATRQLTFADIKNDILTFKPALALRNTSCILCHSSVKGNVVTDMNFSTNGLYEFHGMTAGGTGDYLVSAAEENSYKSRSISIGTSFIEGTFFVPKLNLGPASKAAAQQFFFDTKAPGYNWYQTTTPTSIITVADYLNSLLSYRTDYFLDNVLRNFTSGGFNYGKDSSIIPRNVGVREVKSVFIGWPAASKITSFLETPNSYQYYLWDNLAQELTNFGKQGDRFFGNLNPDATMNCDGDLFVEGPVFLKNLKLKTTTGCRIYATGAVFIQAPAANIPHRDGITFIDETATSNIQITSSKGVFFGLGKCSSPSALNGDYPVAYGTEYARRAGAFGYRRYYHDDARYGATLVNIQSDYDLIRSGTDITYANQLNEDAGNCAASNDPTWGNYRSVDFRKILVNAPRIDSRYSGNFNGVLIGGHSVWSLGKFTYKYDATFDSIPILPFFTPDVFFSVTDCRENDIDGAVIKDYNTGYRSCN